MKKIFLLPLFLLFFASVSAFSFRDKNAIPQWAIEPSKTLFEAGIMQGDPDGDFAPNRIINRAEVVTLFFRMKNIEVPTRPLVAKTFKDLTGQEWFSRYVYEGVNRGWLKGNPDGNYYPARGLNRAELATLLMRVFDLEFNENKQPDFEDVSRNKWYYKGIASLYNHNLLRYPEASIFNPSRPVSRAEMAWYLAEILSKKGIINPAEKKETSSNSNARSARDFSYKPKNFNSNKQGVEDSRKNLVLNGAPEKAEDATDKIIIKPGDEWRLLGEMELKNEFDTKAIVNSLEFAVRLPDGVGPENRFELKLESGQFLATSEGKNGAVLFFSGIDMTLVAGKKRFMKIYLRPKKDYSFLDKAGDGRVVIQRSYLTVRYAPRAVDGFDRPVTSTANGEVEESVVGNFRFQP